MTTLQVSQFKARCLRLLKQVQRTGEELTVTLRGKPLATVGPPRTSSSKGSVRQTLRELRGLLEKEQAGLEAPPRRKRPSAQRPLPE